METFLQTVLLSIVALLLVLFFWAIIRSFLKVSRKSDGPQEQGTQASDDDSLEKVFDWENLPFDLKCRIVSQTINCEREWWIWYITLRWVESDEMVEKTFLVPSAVMHETPLDLSGVIPDFRDKCIVFTKLKETELYYVNFKVFPCS